MLQTFNTIESILYVEDEQGIREELASILENFCERLYIAENGQVGLELYKKYTPKIIITDIKMPLMNGIEMIKAIKKLDDNVHAIFTTAFSDVTYMQEAIALQATGYILKPIDLEMLESMLKKTIEVLKMKQSLDRKTKLLNEYLHVIDENVLISTTDLDGVITSVSQAFCDISGYTKEELIGEPHTIVRDKDAPKELYTQILRALIYDDKWEGELKNRKKDGSFYWVQAKIYPSYNEEGIKIGYTYIRQDITNFKIVQEISIRDGLTNSFNRRYFNEVFEKFIQSAKRKNELICFSIVDIDFFKQYNDTYGHQEGDEALIKVAHSIEGMLSRADDLFFRLGGEEFGILFKADKQESAYLFLNKVVKTIGQMHIPHSGSSVCDCLTISAGLEVQYARSVIDSDQFYKAADDLLYVAKESGRNRVSINKIKEQNNG